MSNQIKSAKGRVEQVDPSQGHVWTRPIKHKRDSFTQEQRTPCEKPSSSPLAPAELHRAFADHDGDSDEEFAKRAKKKQHASPSNDNQYCNPFGPMKSQPQRQHTDLKQASQLVFDATAAVFQSNVDATSAQELEESPCMLDPACAQTPQDAEYATGDVFGGFHLPTEKKHNKSTCNKRSKDTGRIRPLCLV